MIDQESLWHKLVKKWIWLYIFPIIIAPLAYFNRIIISNDLSVSDVGIFYSVISFFAILWIYNDLGFSDALNFFIPKFLVEKKYDKVKTTIYTTFILQFISCGLISLGLYFSADFLATNYFHSIVAGNLLKILILYFFWLNFLQSLQFIFLVFQDTFRNKFTEYLQALLLFIFVLIIWKFWFDSKIFLYSYARTWAIFIIVFVWIIVFLKKYLKILNLGKFKFIKKDYFEIQKFAIWSLLWLNLWSLLANIDQQLTIYLLWPEKAGYYVNTILMFNLLWVFIWPFMGYMYPLASELLAKKQHDKINFLINFMQKYYWAFTIFSSIFFFVFAEILVKIFLGDKFLISGQVLRRSILFLYFNMIMLIYFNFLAGMWKIKERVNMMAIWIIFNVLSILILTRFLDIYGIALSNWLTNLLLFVLCLYYLKKLDIKIILDWKFLLKNLIYCIIFALFSWFFILDMFVAFSNRWLLLLNLFIVWIIYLIWMLLINFQEVRMFIYEIKKITKK